MTRTGKSPRLSAHLPEPFVEVHASDALAAGLADGKFARVSTQYGSCVLKVMVSEGQRRGCLFAPIHWTSETSFSARIGELVGAHTDPLSGQPEAKGTPATIAPVLYDFRGFVLVRRTVELPTGTWWSCVAVTGGFGVMLATNATGEVWRERVRAWFDTGTEVAQYVDQPRGIFRAAAFVGGWLEGCVFIGPAGGASAWGAVKALFELGKLDDAQRRTLLSGRPADGLIATGPVVCACFGVGLTAVRMAMASGAATSVEAIGAALRAGTNCGSCLPELKRILQQRLAASV
jgi:assimilatory nitrate reductase catalytic subunit